jgi:hypothetical protein
MSELQKNKIDTHDLKSIHLMYHAELNGIICSGIMRGKEQTYALLQKRVKKVKSITREEALAKLAERYFTSHGPATLEDFTWWSGLNATESRKALEMVEKNFVTETFKSKTYLFADSFAVLERNKPSFYLLPAFDEYLISYKDRSAAIQTEHQPKAFSSNGIFWPTIIMNGKVIGLWKRNIQKDKVITEAAFFKKAGNAAIRSFKRESKKYGKFVNKKVETKGY